MGALRRATREEIEVCNSDPAWWPETLDSIRESGGPAEVITSKLWSYGAFIGWVRSDEERSAEYDVALKDFAHRAILDTITIIDASTTDDVPVAKERVKTRQWAASRWDRNRYGEHTKIEHSGNVNLIALLSSLPNGSALPALEEKQVEALPEPEEVDEI